MKTNDVRYQIWLRLEGAAELAVLVVLFAKLGGNWWWFAGLFLVPDLAMLGYLKNARVGGWLYNLAHSYAVVGAIWLVCGGYDAAWLIWAAHIAFDRMMGYGLKSAESFQATHLGGLGSK